MIKLPINIHDLLTAHTIESERLINPKMTEGRGAGIPKILRAIKNNGSPLPIFHTEEDRSYFNVEFLIHPEFAHDKLAVKSSGKMLGHTAQKVLRILRENPLSAIPDIAAELELSERAIEKQLRNLREAVYPERIGPAKGGHWRVIDD